MSVSPLKSPKQRRASLSPATSADSVSLASLASSASLAAPATPVTTPTPSPAPAPAIAAHDPAAAFLAEVDEWLLHIGARVAELETRHQRHLSGLKRNLEMGGLGVGFDL